MITTINDHYYCLLLLLLITTIDDHYYWWSLLLIITTIGDHYRGSDLLPCLHADAFHPPVSKPLYQRSQIKMQLHQRSPQSKTEKCFLFNVAPKRLWKKLWLQSIGLLYKGWLFLIWKKKAKAIIPYLDRDAPSKHEVSELQANVCSELRWKW